MLAPTITLNGKDYTAGTPKAGVWRKIIKFNNNFANKNLAQDEEAYEEMLNLIAIGFNNKEVTPELIEDGLDLDELMPKFTEISTWIGSIVNSKVKQLPNA